MTTEPTQPQPELGPAPANGQGQSQGHRRRRRRRKNKSNQPGGSRRPAAESAQPAQPQMQAPQQPHSRVDRPSRRLPAGTEEEEVLPAKDEHSAAGTGQQHRSSATMAGARRDRGDREHLSVRWTTATAP